ncbi:hypothetical protein C2E23DRAFT_734760 [Lenzites betulinus]|nr:hypothetical protein C2E23DRAFT_734760 [Lenzites betulinus]
MSLATDARASPFTVQEFSDLLSSAFNLHDADLSSPSPRPALSFTPPSPHPPALPGGFDDLASTGGFESETDDDHRGPRSPSLDGDSPQLSPRQRRSRSRTITALRVFHQVRTRASAFVLRPRAPSESRNSPSPVPFEPLTLLSISPTLIPSSTISRSLSPLSMVNLNLDRPSSRPRSRADSLPRAARFFKRETTPPPLPGRETRPNTSAGTSSASSGLRSFFDDSPQKHKRAYSRPSTSASTVHPLSRVTSSNSAHAVLSGEGLPSFFEDTGYQVAKPAVPHYSRPSTPAPGGGPRIHTRLPPLRKSKSGGQGLFGRGGRKGNSKSDENVLAKLGVGDSAFWDVPRDGRTPSPFTCPRDAPPVPGRQNPAIMGPFGSDSLEDLDAPLPPAYVFERRGSAQSNSTASTRSSSSISSKISSIVSIAFPSKMRTQARSKLNLSIATGPDPASAHSSPSTLSSLPSPTTPVSPTTAFPRSQPYVFPGGLEMDRSFAEAEEDALAIGRVLTPEEDPFAKADISIPIEGTPRPPTPPVSRRASSQTSPPAGLYRSPTWDEDRVKATGPLKRTRNSMPASPVSAAFTFPSSCSVYSGQSPAVLLPPTPRRIGPPSAWSPFSTPAASSPPGRTPSTPTSSPGRSASSPSKSGRRVSSQSPPSPTISSFPLPPRTLPPPFPPPSRALPALPSPRAPPVPPKDSPLSLVARSHKSLPPSPRLPQTTTDSPASVRSYGGTWTSRSNDCHLSHLPLGTDIRDLFAHTETRPIEEPALKGSLDISPSSLGEPWSGCDFGDEWANSEVPSGWRIRPVVRRRSVDSTSTVTASPSSSTLHDATRNWASSSPGVAIDPPVLKLNTLCAANASSVILPGAADGATDSDSDCCSSAVSLTTFYTAPSSPGPDSPAQTSPVVSFAHGL